MKKQEYFIRRLQIELKSQNRLDKEINNLLMKNSKEILLRFNQNLGMDKTS